MAAATAIIGTTLAVAGATKSFLDASKQEKARKEANAAADVAMNNARKKLDENFYEGLDINLKSFEQERNALAGVGQQLVQAGQEGERGAGAMAGRVMLGVQKAEQEITNRQIGSMENLEKLVAGEESRLQGQRVALDLGEAEGAQLAARDAAAAKNAAITQGVTQLGQAGMGLYQSSELYGGKEARQSERLKRQFTPTNFQRNFLGKELPQSVNALTSQPGTVDFNPIGGNLLTNKLFPNQ